MYDMQYNYLCDHRNRWLASNLRLRMKWYPVLLLAAIIPTDMFLYVNSDWCLDALSVAWTLQCVCLQLHVEHSLAFKHPSCFHSSMVSA